jgi:hypothetical protein
MLLPTKYIPESQTLLTCGGIVLSNITRPCTLTSLWEKIHKNPQIGTFEQFVLTLDTLYILGAIEITQGLIQKNKK